MGWMEETYPTGVALRLFRRERGLSQEAVAAELRVNQSMISKWESGRERPSFANERAIWTLIGERPISERLEGLVEAIASMPLSVGLFDSDGRPIAESPIRVAWTEGASLWDLETSQDHANFARFGGLKGILSRPGLSFSYHRRRVYTGEHTLVSGQRIQIGRMGALFLSVAPLPAVSQEVCGDCGGYGGHGQDQLVPCPACGGFGYRPDFGSRPDVAAAGPG